MAYVLGFSKDVTGHIYSMRDWKWEMVRDGGKTPSASCFNTGSSKTADRAKPLIDICPDLPAFLSGVVRGETALLRGLSPRGPVRKLGVPNSEEHPDLPKSKTNWKSNWFGTIDVWIFLGREWQPTKIFYPTTETVLELQQKRDSSLSELFWVCQPCDDEESRIMMRKINAQ